MVQANRVKQAVLANLLSAAFWILLAVAVAGQLHFRGDLDWNTALVAASRDFLPWIVLTPIAMWLSQRFTIERGRVWHSVPIHMVASIAALILCAPLGTLITCVIEWLAGTPQGSAANFGSAGPSTGASRAALEMIAGPQPLFLFILAARLNIPLYWAIVSVAHALLFYRRALQRERHASELAATLATARLQALTMQLQPHFLFNALNAIAAFVHSNPDLADEMIGCLGELLRTTLDSSRGQEIRLEDEVALLWRYLRVEQARFGDRLRVNLEIAPDTLSARVPTLLLQPLVENAVRHGVEPRTGVGLVSVRAWQDGGQLRLLIEDNGFGAIGPARPGMGIGLANTRARMRELYGESGWMETSTIPESGWRVELGMPLRIVAEMPERAPA